MQTNNAALATQAYAVPNAKPRLLRRMFIVAARVLLVFLFLGAFVLSILPWGRAIARATLVLPAVLTASQPGPLRVLGEPVHHTQMTVSSQGGMVDLDVYAPSTATPLVGGLRGGVLVVSGVGDNRREPQLVNLFEALARSGLVVMNMTTPTLTSYALSVQDGDATVQSFKVLEHLPGMAGQRIGIITFSAGVPFACLAAADPRIRDDVAYVTAFGGYFNTSNLLRTFGLRALNIDGKMERWQPNEIPLEVLANVAAENLPVDEGTILRQALYPGGMALSADELARLSPGAQAAYRLLAGIAPERVDADMAALPATLREQLDQLSPSRVIGQIRAPIYLMHDRNDTSLPVSESRAFAQALARIHHAYKYVELHIFNHVEVRSKSNSWQLLVDGSQLFSIMSVVLG